ncbi:sugar efflux transporter [Vibrio sp. Of7-15]|nr:sugar efflux transporter [Vibrio sp. Of7-15]
MSLFLVEGLGVEPIYIGLYTISAALSGMIMSQKLGGLSDRGIDSKTLFLCAVFGIVLAALSFSLLTEFWQALVVGIVFMGLGSSSIPLILAMIRRFAEGSGQNSTKINSQMRSSVSLIWIVGPALAFASVDNLGFSVNFYVAALIALFVIAYTWKILPNASVATTEQTKIGEHHKASVRLPKAVWFLGGVVFFANVANSTYITAMPLYVTQEMGFPVSFPGLLLGMTAAFEIPIMLLAANWSQKVGKVKLLLFSFGCAVIFYILLQMITSMAAFVVIQLFNGLFFGIFVGLGVTVLQDEAPDFIGKATAFYTNAMAVGTMAGTSVMGLLSQYFGYKSALLLCLGSMLIAFVLLLSFELRTSRNSKQALA